MKRLIYTGSLAAGAALYGYFGWWVPPLYVVFVTLTYFVFAITGVLPGAARFSDAPVPMRPGIEHPDADNNTPPDPSGAEYDEPPRLSVSYPNQPDRPSGETSKPPEIPSFIHDPEGDR